MMSTQAWSRFVMLVPVVFFGIASYNWMLQTMLFLSYLFIIVSFLVILISCQRHLWHCFNQALISSLTWSVGSIMFFWFLLSQLRNAQIKLQCGAWCGPCSMVVVWCCNSNNENWGVTIAHLGLWWEVGIHAIAWLG